MRGQGRLRDGRLWIFVGFWSAVALAGAPGVSRAASPAAATQGDAAPQVQVMTNYGKLPLYFIANQGQVDPAVKFYERGPGRTVGFTEDSLWFFLRRPKGGTEAQVRAGRPGARRWRPERRRLTPPPSLMGRDWLTREVGSLVSRLLSPLTPWIPPKALKVLAPEAPQWETVAFRQTPVGMSKGVRVRGLERQGHRVNYFIGNDPEKWRTDIPTYAGVVYEEAYRGVDLKFYGQGRRMEYDIVVKPGADPSQVQFQYAGVERLEVTKEGDLALHLPGGGVLIQEKPCVYQEVAGVRVAREGKFRVRGDTARPVLGFEVAAYDRKRPLIIDPVLRYSTYLGGGGNDYGSGIAVDQYGCAYVTGQTDSTGFPTLNYFQKDIGGSADVFVTKFNAAGNALVYSTYLGGDKLDAGYAIAVDGNGCAYVTGCTNSSGTTTGFPTKYAYQGDNQGGSDAFVTKLNAGGDDLVYSTYLGGDDDDLGYGIAVDGAGCAYVTGETYSSGLTGFPITLDAYQATNGGYCDAFVTKLSFNDGSHVLSLAYSTYLGGGDDDRGYGIAVDGAGCAYVTGETYSTDFPHGEGALQTGNSGNLDAFVTKLNASGTGFVYSTYLGGGGYDRGDGIAVDGAGCAYVTGETNSSGDTRFPIHNPYLGDNQGGYDAFVSKLNAAGDGLVYSTYLGGDGNDRGYGIAVDGAGCAYVTGYTAPSSLIPFPTTPGAYQRTCQGGEDVFITTFKPAGNDLVYSTYLGGANDDEGTGMAVDRKGGVYVTGSTSSSGSTGFPTRNAYQGENQGPPDVFVTKLEQGSYVPLQLLLQEQE